MKFSGRRNIVLPLNFYPGPHECLRKSDDFGKLAFAFGFYSPITELGRIIRHNSSYASAFSEGKQARMSITLDYFFNYPNGLTAIAELMNKNVGCSLSPVEGDPNDLFSRFLGMELSLLKTEIENDGELNFEDFDFHLSLRTPFGLAQLRGMQMPAMAFIAYVLNFGFGVTGMLVFDGQILLARYEQRPDPESGENQLYDSVSGQFVSFPAHLVALESLWPEDY